MPNNSIFTTTELKRKPGQRCGICDCYNGIRCAWGFRLKKDPQVS